MATTIGFDEEIENGEYNVRFVSEGPSTDHWVYVGHVATPNTSTLDVVSHVDIADIVELFGTYAQDDFQTLVEDVLVAASEEQLRLADLKESQWESTKATAGGPNRRFAGWGTDGYSKAMTRAEASALINHPELDGLGWAACGHTGPALGTDVIGFAGFNNGVATPLNAAELVLACETPLTIAIESIVEPITDSLAGLLDSLETNLQGQIDTLTAVDLDLQEQVDNLVEVGFIGFQTPYITDIGVEWMEVSDTSPQVQALSANFIRYQAHYEESNGAEYTEIGPTCATASGTCGLQLALYSSHPTTHMPHELLWSSSSVTINNVVSLRNVAFSAGTWTTAGAAFHDSITGNFVSPQGQTVWKATLASGNINYRAITNPRSIGRSMLATNKAFTGFNEVPATTGVLPATATPIAITSQIPVLPLKLA